MMIPKYQELMLPLLCVAENGEVRVGEAVEILAKKLKLTNEERIKMYPESRGNIFYNRVNWAKLDLISSALLHSTRYGYFEITDRGREVLAEAPEPFDAAYLRQLSEPQGSSQQFTDGRAGDETTVGQTPDETMWKTHQSINEKLRMEILERIIDAPYKFLEQLVVTLLVQMNYGGPVNDPGQTTGGPGDGGVDGLVNQDILGLDQVYIQTKRYSKNNGIGPSHINSFSGSLNAKAQSRAYSSLRHTSRKVPMMPRTDPTSVLCSLTAVSLRTS